MEESKQQKLFVPTQQQQQQQMQQRQQQLLLMQHLQKQQQQAAMSRFPSNIDAHLRTPGLIQSRPVNPSLQNANPNPISGPNLIPHANHFQQQQQNAPSPQMMMMMQQQQQQQQKSMVVMQQQQNSMRPVNQSELQFAYQDAWRVCHPDFKRPFASLEDACERLLPYHVVADYEAEEDDRILDSDTTSQTLPRSQQWDNNIAAKVAEFTATFEKQAQAFNIITQKRRVGELRSEEKLMVEQALLQDERKACIDVKSELDREMKAQEARLRMAALAQAGQVKAESHQSHTEMMARNPLRANAIGNHGEQGRNMNPDEVMMMMMHGWGNHHHHNNNTNSQREEKEPVEDFLNDEENENGEAGEHGNWRGNGEFDLNTR
ncbi:unnamed protein product [Thlaspi arvense]|uniref:GLTSCR protein conserved domain-containing protein n=1 Tax=Thlaspi arvense TaxID=13288 RepID=A0AAU9S1S2_THLAR|nr:unnamed protein product [Thlaspi arvense]